MPNRTDWDYLIVTAANAPQAAAYQAQIQLRREIGELPQVRHVLAIRIRMAAASAAEAARSSAWRKCCAASGSRAMTGAP